MTRYTFGGYGGDQVTQSPSANAGVFKAAGSLASTGTFWSAQTGGTQYTDLVDPNNAGAPITGVSTDANGRPLAFQGPNGVTEGWLDFGGGRFKIQATDAGYLAGAASDARYVAQGQAMLDLSKQSGVDNTGAVDCASAIQSAIDSATSLGVRVFARGTFKIGSTVTIKGNADLGDATFNYTGTTVAVQVGAGSANWRYKVALPTVSYASKPTTGWTAGTVGVRCYNTMQCNITVTMITGFESGLQMYADGTNGCVYNTVHVGSLANNKRNLHLTAVSSGYVNQNTFIGGGYSHFSSEGTNVAGTRHVLLDHLAGSSADPNNNLWLNPSMESPTVVEYVLDVSGTYNMWLNGRFEYTSGSPKVWWQATAVRNQINGGNNVDAIVETWTAGSGYNTIIGTNGGRFQSASSAGHIFENDGSSANSSVTIMAAGATAAGTSTSTGYCGRFEAFRWRGKAAADTSDRLSLDFVNRSITFGAGVSASAVTQTWGSGSPEGVTTANQGSSYYNYGAGSTGFGQYMKASGTGNTGWHAVGFQPFTTAARPAASLAGIGGVYYDTTLSKPGFSDGTTWRDAAGTAI